MWKSIWSALEVITNVTHRLTRMEKDLELVQKENRDLNREIQSIWLQLEKLVERERYRDEIFRREIELERAKAESG
jgi:hypothetical protein